MDPRQTGTLMRDMKYPTRARSDRRMPGYVPQSPLALGNPPIVTGWKDVTEAHPSFCGITWDKHIPARGAALQRDIVLPNLYQFEVAPGDECTTIDGVGSGKERCELSSQTKMAMNTATTTDYWMRIWQPAPKDAGSDGWVLMGQLHQTPDGGDIGASPLFAREIESASTRRPIYNRRTSTVDPLVSNPSSNYFTAISGYRWTRWVHVVEQHLIDPTGGTGYHKVYHDGVLVTDATLRNTGYVDAVGPYPKFGIYRAADASVTTKVQFYFNGSIMA